MTTDKAIRLIVGLQRMRATSLRARNASDNKAGAFLRGRLGWKLTIPEKERNKIRDQAAKLLDELNAKFAAEQKSREGQSSPDIHAACADADFDDAGEDGLIKADHQVACAVSLSVKAILETFWQTSALWQNRLDQIEPKMREAARLLPAMPWVESIKGMGELGLAIIVGEAGDLSKYSNPAKLWKRLGLAPKDCYRMTTKEGTEAFVIPRQRRSAIWTVTDSLLRQDNEFSKCYRERREYELKMHPEFDRGIDKKTGKQKLSKHGDNRARRYAEKRMIRELWREWRDAIGTSGAEGHDCLVTHDMNASASDQTNMAGGDQLRSDHQPRSVSPATKQAARDRKIVEIQEVTVPAASKRKRRAA